MSSSSTISWTSLTTNPAYLGSSPTGNRRGGWGSDSAGSGSNAVGQGATLFASLLQALTQAVASAQAGGSPTTTAAAGTAATTAAATAGTGSTAAAGSGTSTTNLAQALQAFLHDLFYALAQAGRANYGAGNAGTPVVASTSPAASGAAPVAAAVAAGDATTSTPATAGSTAAATVTAASTPAVTSDGTAPSSAASVATGAGQYGQQGIIAALQALVQDLSDSQELSSTVESPGLSANTLSNLNTAFTQLIGDLDGGTTGSSTTAAGSTTTSSPSSTSALQSFLTGFLQDLQNNGSSSLSALGATVNTTA